MPLTLLDDAARPALAELTVRRSRFIGEACRVRSWPQAEADVRAARGRNPKARHVAYAAVWNDADGNLSERMSDDGEPSGTAGRPILGAIRNHGFTDCVVSVTRYFGGVLLGSGGLIRAYASAASRALGRARPARVVPCTRFQLMFSYARYDSVMRLIARFDGICGDRRFTEGVSLVAQMPTEHEREFLRACCETFHGEVTPARLGPATRLVPSPRGTPIPPPKLKP